MWLVLLALCYSLHMGSSEAAGNNYSYIRGSESFRLIGAKASCTMFLWLMKSLVVASGVFCSHVSCSLQT